MSSLSWGGIQLVHVRSLSSRSKPSRGVKSPASIEPGVNVECTHALCTQSPILAGFSGIFDQWKRNIRESLLSLRGNLVWNSIWPKVLCLGTQQLIKEMISGICYVWHCQGKYASSSLMAGWCAGEFSDIHSSAEEVTIVRRAPDLNIQHDPER